MTPYLEHLHNPNTIAFYTDPLTHQMWLYTALTEKLVRFKYEAGDAAPKSPPETLATFPAYGLNYKYGGWHLTRTVAFAPCMATRGFTSRWDHRAMRARRRSRCGRHCS